MVEQSWWKARKKLAQYSQLAFQLHEKTLSLIASLFILSVEGISQENQFIEFKPYYENS